MIVYLKSTIDLMIKNGINVEPLVNSGEVKMIDPNLIYLIIQDNE